MELPDDLTPFDEAALAVVLTDKELAFISEYLIDLNASQSALRAGYSPGTGYDLMRRPTIAARIRIAMAQRAVRTKFTQDSVLHEMSLLANSRLDWFAIDDFGQVTLTDKAPEGAMGAVASIKRKTRVVPGRPGKGDNEGTLGYTEYDVEIKLWDKPTPLKLMGRHVGLFPDKVEHSGPGGGPIETVSRVERVIIDSAIQETK